MMKISRLALAVILAWFLSACSPHPGAGVWVVAADEAAAEFVRLNVMYEGRTDMFGAAGDSAIRRCFWHGIDAAAIEMKCVVASDTEREELYLLRVDSASGVAELARDGNVVGRYRREVPSN